MFLRCRPESHTGHAGHAGVSTETVSLGSPLGPAGAHKPHFGTPTNLDLFTCSAVSESPGFARGISAIWRAFADTKSVYCMPINLAYVSFRQFSSVFRQLRRVEQTCFAGDFQSGSWRQQVHRLRARKAASDRDRPGPPRALSRPGAALRPKDFCPPQSPTQASHAADRGGYPGAERPTEIDLEALQASRVGRLLAQLVDPARAVTSAFRTRL